MDVGVVMGVLFSLRGCAYGYAGGLLAGMREVCAPENSRARSDLRKPVPHPCDLGGVGCFFRVMLVFGLRGLIAGVSLPVPHLFVVRLTLHCKVLVGGLAET